ncbi:MerR family transcriptional regulator [Microlunatus aurantiacus]|uniref:MerR family transcriptional regulator n=1 Tax=Microlunatus aurantiacus TaxID=446786 RepID=A0ABP7E1M6_9ACTN
MLTISQLAGYVGVSVRTVRHYHQLGLLTEPPRDHSGYRRYGADDVIALKRISTLARSGVPLAQIPGLLAAEPAEFGRAIAGIDAELETQIAELRQRRDDLAQLPSAERLCIPDEVAEILALERELGLRETTVEIERNSWILLSAAYPDMLAASLAMKRACLADAEYRALVVAMDAAVDWDPDDPRLVDLARTSMAVLQRLYPVEVARAEAAEWARTDEVTVGLLIEMNEQSSPAWLRLYELVGELTREGGYPDV